MASTMRVAGTVLLAIAVMCLPISYAINPKRDQSVFHNLADMGAFLRVGAITGLVGLGLLIAGTMIRRDDD